jgi:small subunit ribosomal protein S6
MILAEKRVYEVLYIVDTDTPEDEATRLTESLRQTITDQGGTITRQEVLGRRNLAYRIGRKNEGVYNLFEIEGTGREIAELERRMRVMDQVIRYMTVRVDEDRQRAEKFKERRTRRASKRAGAGASGSGSQRRGAAGEGEA